MFLSIFSDEIALDITEGLPIFKSWGLDHVDLRGRVFGKAAEALPPEKLPELRKLLDSHGMKVGCLESSLAKVHLPDTERRKAEQDKLEGIIRAADALDCRLVRAFFFWQPKGDDKDLAGQLSVRPDEQQKVLDYFAPLAERAKRAGLILAFENCGIQPDEVFTILDALSMPSWGMAWDPHNDWPCAERQKDEDAYILKMMKRTKLLHIKAVGAVNELGKFQIPYDKVLQVASTFGIGPVSVETHNPDRSIPNLEMSKRVVDVIKKSWPSAAPGGIIESAPKVQVTRPWQDNPVGFVVVGLGMGHNRAKQLTKTVGNRLIGVCDLVEDRAKRTAEAFNVPYSTDLKRWLKDETVEVIYVVTETGRHAEVAMQALEAGKHVLSTKPMEAALAPCDEMIRLADRKKLLLGVDFDRRFVNETHTLRNAVNKGQLGRLLSGNFSLKIQRTMDYFRSNGGWRGTRRWDGGGVLSNQAIHNLDEIAFTVGIPKQVRCNIWTQNHQIEAEDLGMAMWLYDDGLVINFWGTTSYPKPTWYTHYELEGTQGAYYHASGGPIDGSKSRWLIDGAWRDTAPEPVPCPWVNATDNFAAAVRTGAPLLATGRDGRRSQAILEAMYRSAYEAGGGWVEVDAELK